MADAQMITVALADDATIMISLDLGVWSSACKWNPIGP